MLDIAVIREDPGRVKQALKDLNDEETIPRIDAILDLDERRRALLTDVEGMRAERNSAVIHPRRSCTMRPSRSSSAPR